MDHFLTLQHIYIYIYMLWSHYFGQVWGVSKVNILAKFVFFQKQSLLKKHYKIWGFSTLKKQKQKNARQISKKIFWPTWFFWGPQLGQNIDFNLAKILTLKMVIFCFLKKCWNTYFIVFFELPPKFAKEMAPNKNDNFSLFAKHRVIKKKKRFVATPLFTPKMVFFNLFFETKKQWCSTKTWL